MSFLKKVRWISRFKKTKTYFRIKYHIVMKNVFAILSALGIIVPYYFIYKFIESNNWEWSTSLFFEQVDLNYAMNILSADLTIAATSFMVFLVYKFKTKSISQIQFVKYVFSLFLVGFSLALPLYLYDNYREEN